MCRRLITGKGSTELAARIIYLFYNFKQDMDNPKSILSRNQKQRRGMAGGRRLMAGGGLGGESVAYEKEREWACVRGRGRGRERKYRARVS